MNSWQDHSDATRGQRRRWAALALLAAVGPLINTLPIPLFYGIHILLGSVPAILAVLLWRTPWAILIGSLASLHTWALWGHPWAVVIFTAEILWLTICSRRWNGPRINDGNGRILLFSIGYWFLIGSPLVGLFYGLVMKIDLANVTIVAIKQSFNGILNTVIALGIFLGIQAWQARREKGPGVSLRGVILILTLSAILIPTLVVSVLSGERIEIMSQQAVLDRLKAASLSTAQAMGSEQIQTDHARTWPGSDGEVDYQILTGQGKKFSSDPQLFNHLNSQFTEGGRDHLKSNDLSILIPREPGPSLKKWVNGYWSYSQQYPASPSQSPTSARTNGGFVVQVIRPARPVVIRVQEQSSQLLGTALALMVIGALISDRAGVIISREFDRVITPLRRKSEQLAPLQLSAVMEIKQLSLMINHRLRQVNQLSSDLRNANHQLKASQVALEELLTRDKLTGCGTAKALEQRLIEEWHRSQRTKDPFCCLWINLDGFRATNALVGPETGNTILRCVASSLSKRLRITDHLYRWDADQFVVLATGCYPDDGQRLGSMLQRTIEDIYLESESEGSCHGRSHEGSAAERSQRDQIHGEIRLSASVGVSCSTGGHSHPQLLLQAARAAVEAARPEGPGQLVVAHGPAEPV